MVVATAAVAEGAAAAAAAAASRSLQRAWEGVCLPTTVKSKSLRVHQ